MKESVSSEKPQTNVDKFKMMVNEKDNLDVPIQTSDTDIEQVQTFKYLGVKIQKSKKIQAEITVRLEIGDIILRPN